MKSDRAAQELFMLALIVIYFNVVVNNYLFKITSQNYFKLFHSIAPTCEYIANVLFAASSDLT